MVKARAVVLFAAVFGVMAPAAHAEPPQPPPASSDAWKQIYEDSQTVYYVSAATTAADVTATQSLLEFKVPQVVGSAQAWSVVSRMRLNCDTRQVVTVDNTTYAHKMGTGTVVQSQGANDSWHQPEPGSLGELIWSTVCGKK
jgi:hypothetical protein